MYQVNQVDLSAYIVSKNNTEHYFKTVSRVYQKYKVLL